MLVDRMAALWWRLQRLAARQQVYLAERLKAAEPLAAVEEAEASALQEARLDRMLRATRKDLLARQAWRLGATARRVAARRSQWKAEIDERGLDSDQREWQERMARMRAQQAAHDAAGGGAHESAPLGGNGLHPGGGTGHIPPNGSGA
jgi:membrane protein involved in colicin uptake